MINLLAITKTKFFSLLLNGLITLSSILHAYPLHILFLCFFTPYILKILSFLSPLFITTSLLIISLFTLISPGFIKDTFFGTHSSNVKANYLLSAYDTVSKILQHNTNDENEDFHSLEALEMYNMVFNSSMFDERGNHVDVSAEGPEEKILQIVESSELKKLEISEDDEQDCSIKAEEVLKVDTVLGQDSSIDDSQLKSIKSVIKKFEGLLEKQEESEAKSCNEEIKTVETRTKQAFGKKNTEQLVEVVHYDNSMRHFISKTKSKNSQSMRQSTTTNNNDTENNKEFTSKDGSFKKPGSDLGRFGSMRKEREWRSTLACKLFEEKHNSSNIEGIEGMDSLWEKYDEGNSMNQNSKNETKKIESSKFKNVKYEDEEEEKDDFGGHLCCLQAFKLSTSKMNLGVGRRNLTKISKAVKGFGWIHKASKHSKKVHNNNGEAFQFA